jgi:uncharacterized membrane protein
MHIGRKIGISDDKGYFVPVLIALIVVASTVAGFYIYYNIVSAKPSPYNTIFLLDDQGGATDYPQTLVANQNSTFSLNVGVTCHEGRAENQSYQVQVKVTQNLPAIFPMQTPPTQTFNLSLKDGDTQLTKVTLTENTVGNYAVVFELYKLDDSNNYVFTQNYCVLPIQVID